MSLYRVSSDRLEKVERTSFEKEKLLERRDLQRLLKADISVVGEDLLIVSEEFTDWEDSNRRVDLLCVDRQARLVVVELKRNEDGAHMDLQAIRYAAMVSSMTIEKVVATYARFLGGDDATQRADRALRDFLEDSLEEGQVFREVRIILVAADFSTELTTSVLWLNKMGLDLTCVRLRPYRHPDGTILVDSDQVIPLPEAADYEVKIRAQAQESRNVQTARQQILRKFWAQLIERSREKTTLLANRTTTSDHWLSAGIGKAGFSLTFSLTKDRVRIECHIGLDKEGTRSLEAFRALEAQKVVIESVFGGPLDWQELPDRVSCRICTDFEGEGWQTPLTEWPALQERMIETMTRLDRALKPAIHQLKL